jgi:anion-transporting  ArsA/GET3 family ATPase
MKYDDIYESIIGDMAPYNSILRDTQIGDVYIWLVKSGKTYTVKKGRGISINKTTMKTVFTTKNEESARKFFYKVRSKVMDKLGK